VVSRKALESLAGNIITDWIVIFLGFLGSPLHNDFQNILNEALRDPSDGQATGSDPFAEKVENSTNIAMLLVVPYEMRIMTMFEGDLGIWKEIFQK
jgi:hypothetical protein